MAKNQQPQLAGVTGVGEGDTRQVTATDPLDVNEDPANFGSVEIIDGEIKVQVKSTVTFAQLTKNPLLPPPPPPGKKN